MERLSWEYYLCNVELHGEINVGRFSIVPFTDYKERIAKLKKLSVRDTSIETVNAKTTNLLTSDEADAEIASIVSLLSFAQGRTVTYARKFSFSKSQKVEHHTATIFGKSDGTVIILANEIEDFLKAGLDILSANGKAKQTISQALYWYNLGFHGHSIQEYFIKRWIAFEIFVETFAQKKGLKKIVSKNRFPKEDIELAIEEILDKNGYCPKEKCLALKQVGRNLNRVDFMHKAYSFLFEDIKLPHLENKKYKRKLYVLYETRNNLFHKGFGSEHGDKEWTHAILLENLLQRIFLAKLNFKNRYFYGNFWDNPFTYAIGSPR